MAEWSSYLKQAVANVERQLDQVLLDSSSEVSLPRKSESSTADVTPAETPAELSSQPPSRPVSSASRRPDLSQRMRQALNGSRSASTEIARGSAEIPSEAPVAGEVNPAEDIPGHEHADGGKNLQDEIDAAPALGVVRDPGSGVENSVAGAGSAAAAPEIDAKTDDHTTDTTIVNAATNEERISEEKAEFSDANARIENGANEDSQESFADQPQSHQETRQEPKTILKDSVKETPVDISVVHDFLQPPDWSHALAAASKLALRLQSSSHQDAALDLVDVMEASEGESEAFVRCVNTRISSLHSKIAALSAPHIGGSDKLEEKVALLLDEGQRLSAQELKLSQTIRKLRTNMREAEQKRQAAITAKEAESRACIVLRAEKDKLAAEFRDLQAMLEHYRSQAEGVPASGSTNRDGQAALEAAQDAARSRWHNREIELLKRIAELESSADTAAENHRVTVERLQQRLREAQVEARDAQSQAIALQEQVDELTLKVTHGQTTNYSRVDLNDESGHFSGSSDTYPTLELGHRDNGGGAADTQSSTAQSVSAENGGRTHDTEVLVKCTVPVVDVTDTQPQVAEPTEPRTPFEMEKFIDLGPTTSPLRRKSSLDSLPERISELFADRSSELVGSSNNGEQVHLVASLIRTVRALESELAAMRRSTELAAQQREEAQSEMVRLLDSQEELITVKAENADLKRKVDDLEKELSKSRVTVRERTERVAELEADVVDVKGMYREQVETLVAEISRLQPQ